MTHFRRQPKLRKLTIGLQKENISTYQEIKPYTVYNIPTVCYTFVLFEFLLCQYSEAIP